MTLNQWQKKTALPSLLLSLLFTLSFVVPIYWFPVVHNAYFNLAYVVCPYTYSTTWMDSVRLTFT